jgi:hypothetical protein
MTFPIPVNVSIQSSCQEVPINAILHPSTERIQIPIGSEIVVRGNQVFYGTTESWDEQRTLIPKKGTIYIYSDRSTIVENGITKYVPGIKIGDGVSYLIDMPFLDSNVIDALNAHINDSSIHVNREDRTFWDNKISVDISGEELLLLNER